MFSFLTGFSSSSKLGSTEIRMFPCTNKKTGCFQNPDHNPGYFCARKSSDSAIQASCTDFARTREPLRRCVSRCTEVAQTFRNASKNSARANKIWNVCASCCQTDRRSLPPPARTFIVLALQRALPWQPSQSQVNT